MINLTANPKISPLPGSGSKIEVFFYKNNYNMPVCMSLVSGFQTAQWLCSIGPYFMHICVCIYTHTHVSVVLINSGHMSLARKQGKHSGCSCFMQPAENSILTTVCLGPCLPLASTEHWIWFHCFYRGKIKTAERKQVVLQPRLELHYKNTAKLLVSVLTTVIFSSEKIEEPPDKTDGEFVQYPPEYFSISINRNIV